MIMVEVKSNEESKVEEWKIVMLKKDGGKPAKLRGDGCYIP